MRHDEPTTQPAMTFRETAEIEGVTMSAVFQAYHSALRKLRRKRVALNELTALSNDLARNRCSEHSVAKKRGRRCA